MFFLLFFQFLVIGSSCSTIAMNRDYIDSDAYLGPDYPVGCKQGKKFARGLCKKSTGAFKKVTRFSNEGSNFQDGHIATYSDEDMMFSDKDIAYFDEDKFVERTKARGEAIIAIKFNVKSFKSIAKVQTEAVTLINRLFPDDTKMKPFSTVHTTLVYTNATQPEDVDDIDGHIKNVLADLINRSHFDSAKPYMLYGTSVLSLFGAPGLGKKFVGIDVSVDRRIKQLANKIVSRLPRGDATVCSRFHVSIGEIEIKSLDEEKLVQGIIDSELHCGYFDCNMTKITLMHSSLDRPIHYRFAPSYREQRERSEFHLASSSAPIDDQLLIRK